MMGGRNDQADRSGRHYQGANGYPHRICMLISNTRTIKSMNANEYGKFKATKASTQAWNEGDSNTDTFCLGKNFTVLEYTQRTADV